MPGKISIYRRIECLVTNAGMLRTNGIHPQLEDLGIIRDAALVFSSVKGVVWVGRDKELPKNFHKGTSFDCRGLVGYPGLVDSHTHPAFGGDRAGEFARRLSGATYQEIAESGGGILSTVHASRSLAPAKMKQLVAERIARARAFGVRLMEAKSGYGLSRESELAALKAIRAGARAQKSVRILSTCMAAHAFPPEFRDDRDVWVEKICTEILPLVARQKLARFVDAFCDKGYFTNEQTEKVFAAAKKLDLRVRMHGDELADTGGAELAAKLGALSVDHLLKVSESGIKALARSGTIATLLPGTSLFLRATPAPARRLIDGGVAVALATDFNPGTCPTQNLPFIATLGAVQLGMTTAETIAAITWNGARALGMEKEYGALLPGYRGEPVFSQGDDPAAIYYWMAPDSLPQPRRLAKTVS